MFESVNNLPKTGKDKQTLRLQAQKTISRRQDFAETVQTSEGMRGFLRHGSVSRTSNHREKNSGNKKNYTESSLNFYNKKYLPARVRAEKAEK